jgi:hypothetical protein
VPSPQDFHYDFSRHSWNGRLLRSKFAQITQPWQGQLGQCR